MVEQLERGRFMFENLKTVNYRIEYIEEISHNSKTEYNKFCKWLNDKYNNDEEKIIENELEYLKTSLNQIRELLSKINDSNRSIDNIIKLNKIDFYNKDNFKEFLEDMKDEYEFLAESEDINYEHFNRIISWYRLTPDYLNSSIKHLANNKVDLASINFDEINTLDKYNLELVINE